MLFLNKWPGPGKRRINKSNKYQGWHPVWGVRHFQIIQFVFFKANAITKDQTALNKIYGKLNIESEHATIREDFRFLIFIFYVPKEDKRLCLMLLGELEVYLT